MNRGDGPCQRTRESVDLYVDGELADQERVDLEAHIGHCTACAHEVAQARSLKHDLRQTASAFRLSEEFHLRFAERLAVTPAPLAPAPDRSAAPRSRPWLAAAIAFAVALPAGAALHHFVGPPARSTDDAEHAGQVAGVSHVRTPVVEQTVRWHRRQVPVEVTGPSARSVESWFASKVDFPVYVPDFGRDAHLLGGRLGNVDDSAAAVLIYEVGGRKMSVLAFDAERVLGPAPTHAAAAPQAEQSGGYSVLIVRRGPVAYAFTSDIAAGSLEALVADAVGASHE